ncbi:unnamed protein product [Ranitomeya imitator]|uniref:Reverse transcriptase domain-containing protein n=1 Tax=Ranitomeya imitator TaxID=111125 RepID=A0ABN9M008_9NEOB|nr:unnamed protein product [Ranitomeya imitator]
MSAVGFSYSETEVANIVSQVTACSDFLQVSGSEFKSRDLERETRHLVSLELHSITIAEYLKTQRIPRGLRVSLRPTLFHDNSEFCSKFEQILNKCSVDLMTLTLDHLNKEIKNCQEKVSSIEIQLKDSLPKEEFDSVKTRTKENVDNFKKETEKRKRQKFIRDTQDYLQKRVSETEHKKRTRRGGQCYRDKSSHHEHPVSGNESNLVINISKKSLNTSQLRLLEKGLSFCPTYRFNSFQLNIDLERFYRNLRLKAYFHEQTPTISPSLVTQTTPINLKDLGLRLRSNFSPPKNSAPVETFITLINREVSNFCKQAEHSALKMLVEDKDIVIKGADKGGGIVVMDYSYYRAEILSQLSNRDIYLPLTTDPTPRIRNKIAGVNSATEFTTEALLTQVIDKKTKEFLINEFPIIPVFYVLPKIHKNLEKPPGRPIVASTDSILSPLSILLEKVLTPLIKRTPAFLQDTGAFLEIIHGLGKLPENTLLVTLDVNNLYTSIQHAKGIRATEQLLNDSHMDSRVISFLLDLLHLVLTENFFIFEDTFYVQVQGSAMGSNVAPPYANGFMSSFETEFIYSNELYQSHCLLWRRYIDDVFCLWRGTWAAAQIPRGPRAESWTHWGQKCWTRWGQKCWTHWGQNAGHTGGTNAGHTGDKMLDTLVAEKLDKRWQNAGHTGGRNAGHAGGRMLDTLRVEILDSLQAEMLDMLGAEMLDTLGAECWTHW